MEATGSLWDPPGTVSLLKKKLGRKVSSCAWASPVMETEGHMGQCKAEPGCTGLTAVIKGVALRRGGN